MALVRSNVEVALAVDSEDTVRQQPGKPEFRKLICKLYRAGDTFFAVSGLIHSSINTFSVPDLVAAALRDNDQLVDGIKAAEQTIAPALVKVVQEYKRSNPPLYSMMITRKIATEISFVKINNKIPIASVTNFSLTVRDDNTIEATTSRSSCPSDCANGGLVWVTGGADIVNKKLHEGPVLPPRIYPGELAQALVQIVIDADIPGVAGPIDVVRLRPGEPPEVKAKEGCPLDLISGRAFSP